MCFGLTNTNVPVNAWFVITFFNGIETRSPLIVRKVARPLETPSNVASDDGSAGGKDDRAESLESTDTVAKLINSKLLYK